MTRAPKRPRDPNQLAKFIVDVATGEAEIKQPIASAVKGGIARAKELTPKQRAEAGQPSDKPPRRFWEPLPGGSQICEFANHLQLIFRGPPPKTKYFPPFLPRKYFVLPRVPAESTCISLAFSQIRGSTAFGHSQP